MTIEEALLRADEGLLGPISCKILAAEVRRLREERDQILGSIDGGGICEICRERANIRADRYRDGLNNIRTQIAAGTPSNLVWRLADNALRGGEE